MTTTTITIQTNEMNAPRLATFEITGHHSTGEVLIGRRFKKTFEFVRVTVRAHSVKEALALGKAEFVKTYSAAISQLDCRCIG